MNKGLNHSALLSAYYQHPGVQEILNLSESASQLKRFRLHLRGLVASSKSFVAVSVFSKCPAVHFFILPDKESAAYFYNDLENILDEKDLDTEKKKC